MITKIVVADDQHLVRKAFVHTLEMRADYEVCSAVADGDEALRAIKFYKPHILLLDIHMPRMSGLEVLAELRKNNDPVRTIIVSQFDRPETIAKCMELGARGFLSTYNVEDEEQTAIDSVMDSGYYFNTQTGRSLLRDIARLRRFEPHLNNTPYAFDTEEVAILSAYARQLSNDEIAAEICSTGKTVERRKTMMVKALKLDSFFCVFIYALQKGIINLDEIPLRKVTN
jgi:DNA-binding NarL/FixJ family response regulator